ncbi:FHA domain-containing protein, partial [Sphingomonas immobilis]
MPTELVLHRRGALIGRSPTCDWSLPDPRHYISSRHGEIQFSDDFYSFVDISMNGTHLNGSPDRMEGPRRIENGDVFTIGQYEVVAALTGVAAVAIEKESEAAAAAQQSNWGGWASHAPPAPPPVDDGGWGSPPASDDGWGSPPPPASDPGGGGWGAPSSSPAPGGGGGWQPQTGPSLAKPDAHRAASWGSPTPSAPPPVASGWAPSASVPLPAVQSAWEPHVEKQQQASDWSSAAPDRPPVASPDDIWGKIADGNVVDWARGGFGQPIEENRDPLGLNKASAQASLPQATPQMAKFGQNDAWGASPAAAPAPPAAPQNDGWGAPPPAPPAQNDAWGAGPAPE